MKKKCNRCNLEKIYDDFHNRTISKDGKDSQCKVCRSKTTYEPTTLIDAPDINKIPAEQILIKLGYEIYNDDNPVHEQFYQRLKERGINLEDYPHSLFN